jgi:hypothetical protein
MATTGPVAATTGHPLLDRIAPVILYGFYIPASLIAATGLATAIPTEAYFRRPLRRYRRVLRSIRALRRWRCFSQV